MAGSQQTVSPPGEGEELPFFSVKNGEVYARWRSGKPPVRLGRLPEVHAAMQELVRRAGAPQPATPQAATPEAEAATLEAAGEEAPNEATGHERGELRHDTSILGRLRTSSGARDVTVLDLSEHGCRFHDRFGQMPEGISVTIKIGPVGPIAAMVKWRRGEYVGVQFENPLYPSVLEHIRQHFDLRR
jgi:hypothetical protein